MEYVSFADQRFPSRQVAFDEVERLFEYLLYVWPTRPSEKHAPRRTQPTEGKASSARLAPLHHAVLLTSYPCQPHQRQQTASDKPAGATYRDLGQHTQTTARAHSPCPHRETNCTAILLHRGRKIKTEKVTTADVDRIQAKKRLI